MAQTKIGAAKAMETIKRRHGLTKDGKSALHVSAGKIGGKLGNTGGFASTKIGKDGLDGKSRASHYGKIGGVKSKRKVVRHEIQT